MDVTYQTDQEFISGRGVLVIRSNDHVTNIKEELVEYPTQPTEEIYRSHTEYSSNAQQPISEIVADDDKIGAKNADVLHTLQNCRVASPAQYLDLDTATTYRFTHLCQGVQDSVQAPHGQTDISSTTPSSSVLDYRVSNHQYEGRETMSGNVFEDYKRKECEVSSTTCLANSARTVYPWMKVSCPSPSKRFLYLTQCYCTGQETSDVICLSN